MTGQALPAAVAVAAEDLRGALRAVDEALRSLARHADRVREVRGPDGYAARLADWRRRRANLAADLADLEGEGC